MTRALDSAIGLPRDSTRALRMLSLLMPDEVRRYFMMPLLMYTWSRRCRPAKKETSLHALTKSFLNPGNVLGRMPRVRGKHVADGLLTDDGGHRRCQQLHTVVMVRVQVGLIELGDGHPQPLLLLRSQRAQIAQDARHFHSLRVLKT